jgi:ATP-binding cassette subfamily C (CFTR/MRP) protein 2
LIDGVDISKVDLAYLRGKITVIPQDATMFTGTLRFNLDPDGVCSDERVKQILHKAQLDDLMDRDVKGL